MVRIENALATGDLATADAEVQRLTAAQTVDVLERLPAKRRAVLYRLLAKKQASRVFEALSPVLQKDLIEAFKDEEVAAVFADLEPDDRVALLDELPAGVANRLMQGLSAQQRDLTADILGYPKKSIGRRMSPEVTGVSPAVTAAGALDEVRAMLDDAETVYTLPVIDGDRVLLGVVSLRDLMSAPPDIRIADLMEPVDFAHATDSAEQAARLCADSKQLALPVVDNDTRLVGILTVDDALRILEEADSEDQARLAGSETLRQPYLTTSVATVGSSIAHTGMSASVVVLPASSTNLSTASWNGPPSIVVLLMKSPSKVIEKPLAVAKIQI
jgi:magnesium transporter